MSELIDRQALKDYVSSLSTHPLNEWDTWGVIAAIDKQPTVAASPWHRVEEELPKQGEWVLVKSCLVRMMTDFIDKTGRWYRTPGVTHWMPLPDPPKEDA